MISRQWIICCAILGACVISHTQAKAQEPGKPQAGQVHEHVSVPGTMLTPTRESSGTSWLPPETPMFGVHRPWRGWDLRVDGSAFGLLLIEPGDRHRTGGPGERQFGLANWGMMTLRRGVGPGRFGARVMLSAEPLTIPGCGSLSYLATGEVCEDDTVHDRQQPHDAVMELAVDYERPLTARGVGRCMPALPGSLRSGRPAPLIAHRVSSIRSVR